MPLDDPDISATLPDAALALALTEAAAAAGTVLFVDATGARIDRLAAIAARFAPELEILLLPAWDTLPYDRTPPSPSVMGQRVHALARMAEAPKATRLVLTSARALLQRVPAPGHWTNAALQLAPGDTVEPDTLLTRLAEFGYHVDETVDRVGEVAMRGHVIDLFPGNAALPVRIELEDGSIEHLHTFDPRTQRSVDRIERLVLRPIVEAEPPPEQITAEADRIAKPGMAQAGTEAAADAEAVPADPAKLQASLFDYLRQPKALVHPEALQRLADIEEEVAGAFDAALTAARAAGRGASLPKPARLYLSARSAGARLDLLAGAPRPAAAQPLPPARDLAGLAAQLGEPGPAVVAAGPHGRAIVAALKRRNTAITIAPDWPAALASTPSCLDLDIPEGFVRDGLRVLVAPPALVRAPGADPSASLPLEEPPRLSDIVVHGEHGVCRLAGLRRVGEEERLALAFHEGTELLVPIGDLAQLWRYGSEAGHVSLDRLHGEAWHRRRTEIEAEITATAEALAAAAAARARTKAPAIKPAAGYARVVERFAFALSPDQAAAIDAVLTDLAAGRPMDRLVCGDVGFGKTEVALRAAAVTALAGHQVAIVAPTSVLARQHLETFRRRLAGTGIRVEPLLRGATGAAAKPIRDGLADGSIGIVVGTQAVASDKVRFAKLGLVVIDEEQRFGDADKRKLATLRDGEGVHVLVMSATPIPRTLQAAMVGLRDISVIATPPVRRQPTRTFVLPFTEAVVREALLREHGRGGQTFVVAPRIEDLAPLEAALRSWLPKLSVAMAHGRLKPEALEQRVARFAAGDTDILLATNIIEAGLDIPRANTILITGPHRFGLAQLHQMRGRVGRGARRGLAYVLTDPGIALASPTARRLRTLETIEGLGAGVAIAAADMDSRGAGELFGDKQAGHVHAIGTELYQCLLARELARIEGRPAEPPRPELHLELEGRIPEEYVPESNLRLDLYRRLARVSTAAEADDFAAELEDRFGDIPPALAALLDEARLRAWCRDHAVLRVDAGPKAIALTAADDSACLAAQLGGEAKNDRVILHPNGTTPAGRLSALLDVLDHSRKSAG